MAALKYILNTKNKNNTLNNLAATVCKAYIWKHSTGKRDNEGVEF